MARPVTEKMEKLRKLISMELLEGNSIDSEDYAQIYDVPARSVRRIVAEICKQLPKDMIPKKMATEKQVTCAIRYLEDVGRITDPEGLRRHLEALSMLQVSTLIRIYRAMKIVRKALESPIGNDVALPTLKYLDMSDYPYRRK